MNHKNQTNVAVPAKGTALPAKVDRLADGYEKKPTSWRIRIVWLIALMLIGLGVALFRSGAMAAGIAVIATTLAAILIIFIAGHFLLANALGRKDSPQPKENPGEWLFADGMMESLAPNLTEGELATINHNRANEAMAVRAWLETCTVARRIQVRSDDNTLLSGRMYPASRRQRPWVVFFHGFGGSWRDNLGHARAYAELDFNIMLVDMRAHNESDGNWSGLGWLDRRDVVAWCSWIVARTGQNTQIVLHGQGYGAAAALMATQEQDLPSQVRGCICDTAFTDAWNEIRGLLGEGIGRPHPELDLIRYALRKEPNGYDLADARPLSKVRSSNIPLLIIHGEEDLVTAPYMGAFLAMAAGCENEPIIERFAGKECGEEADEVLIAKSSAGSEFLLIPHAGHCQSCFADPATYYGEVFSFVALHVDLTLNEDEDEERLGIGTAKPSYTQARRTGLLP